MHLLASALLSLLATGPAEPPAVVVDYLVTGSGAEKAGLQTGDRLLLWQRPPAQGAFDSFLKAWSVEIEEGQLGPVVVTARRGAGEVTVKIPPGRWGIRTRPDVPDELLASVRAAESRANPATGDATSAAFRDLASRAATAPGVSVWFELCRANALVRANRFDEAALAYGRALASTSDPVARVGLLVVEAGAYQTYQADGKGAESSLREALAGLPRGQETSLTAAALQYLLGVALRGRDDAAAEASWRLALRILSKRAPKGSMSVANRHALAVFAYRRGDLLEAEQLYRQVLELQGEIAPGSRENAIALSNLANVLRKLGSVDEAERRLTEALALYDRLGAAPKERAQVFQTLGSLARERGDFETAEKRYREALDEVEKVTPGSRDLARLLTSIADLAVERGDAAAGAATYERSTELFRKVAPDSLELAEVLAGLADVRLRASELDAAAGNAAPSGAAATAAAEALSIREKKAANGLPLAQSLVQTARIDFRRGRLEEVPERLARARALLAKAAPGSLDESACRFVEAEAAEARGDLPAAETALRDALEVRSRLAAGGPLEVEALHRLGQVLEKRGRAPDALHHFLRAVDALDRQRERLGGSDLVRSRFGSVSAGPYADAVTLLVHLSRPEEALHVLERSRARTLLQLLGERDLALDVSPALLPRLRRLETQDAAVQEQLAPLSIAKDASRVHALTSRLAALRDERSRLSREVARSSPGYAALKAPEPLQADAIRRSLRPGDVWLSYAVTSERTLLLGLAPDAPLLVREIAVPAGTLRDDVRALRSLLQADSGDTADLEKASARLYETLLAPAGPLLEKARHLHISPDGPLWAVPFAALRDARTGRTLVEKTPISVVASGTLLVELGRRRPASRSTKVTIVAAPAYRSETGVPETARDPLSRYRRGLPDLPGAAEEARQIARVLGPGATVALGDDATEERIRSLGKGRGIVHLAVHALFDPSYPLESGLALASPAPGSRQNGLLQVWEILESVRTDADLVTLSGCETGLGVDAAGEGLVGLVRAFQHAGARNVLASLWRVGDASSPRLMTAFYEALAKGAAPDEALRTAQLGLLSTARPAEWAAFVLHGDAR